MFLDGVSLSVQNLTLHQNTAMIPTATRDLTRPTSGSFPGLPINQFMIACSVRRQRR